MPSSIELLGRITVTVCVFKAMAFPRCPSFDIRMFIFERTTLVNINLIQMWNAEDKTNTSHTHSILIRYLRSIAPSMLTLYIKPGNEHCSSPRANEWQSSTLKGRNPGTNIFSLELSTWLIWQLQHLRQVNIVEACSMPKVFLCAGMTTKTKLTHVCLLHTLSRCLVCFFSFLLLSLFLSFLSILCSHLSL